MKKMIRRLKNKLLFLGTMAMTFVLTNPVLAEEVSEVEAVEFNNMLLQTVLKYLQPLGGSIVFIAVVVGGIILSLTAYSPDKRKEAMSGLLYVLLGAVVLGGAMFVAGVFIGVGKSLGS